MSLGGSAGWGPVEMEPAGAGLGGGQGLSGSELEVPRERWM